MCSKKERGLTQQEKKIEHDVTIMSLCMLNACLLCVCKMFQYVPKCIKVEREKKKLGEELNSVINE